MLRHLPSYWLWVVAVKRTPRSRKNLLWTGLFLRQAVGCFQELPRSIYLHLAADRSFELYQSLNTIGYSKYTGTYTVTVYEQKALLSGTYTDGTPWESSYVVESQTAELLRLRSQTAGNISQYVAAEIPDYVKDGITVKNVRAEAEKPFL